MESHGLFFAAQLSHTGDDTQIVAFRLKFFIEIYLRCGMGNLFLACLFYDFI